MSSRQPATVQKSRISDNPPTSWVRSERHDRRGKRPAAIRRRFDAIAKLAKLRIAAMRRSRRRSTGRWLASGGCFHPYSRYENRSIAGQLWAEQTGARHFFTKGLQSGAFSTL